MKNKLTSLIALLILLVFSGSCGRTIYSAKYVKKKKYLAHKQQKYFWHRHHYRARQHYGGYW
jgi:hypothetical protein